ALGLRPLLPADAQLYVLNGLAPGAGTVCVAAGIVPVLNSLEQAERWRDTARTLGRRLPAAPQFDRGMLRLGVSAVGAARLAGDAGFHAQVAIELVMSHLACADTPGHAANAAQLACFAEMAALFPGVPRSLANSGGAF